MVTAVAASAFSPSELHMTLSTHDPVRDKKMPSTAAQEASFTAEGSPPPVVSKTPRHASAGPGAASPRMALDLSALEEAKHSLDKGAVTPHCGPWRDDIIQLLNDSLATELVCVLRYKRHHFTAQGLASPKIAEEFMVHANEESAHADMLATRIVQLGGTPDFSPDSLTKRSHAAYDESQDLKAMITANLIAERVAIESYSQMVGLIGDKDSTTRRLIEEILSVEQAHAEDLRDWLAA
jgi:bacterioferritin